LYYFCNKNAISHVLSCEKTLNMAEKPDIEKIAEGCKKGDTDAFDGLFRIFGDRIYGYFYRLTSNIDTSEDLTSELFVKVVEKIRTYKGPNFTAWIFSVAKNVFYDHLRQKQKLEKIIDSNIDRQLGNANLQNNKNVKMHFDILQQHLERLDDKTKELIVLRFYSDMTFKEIANARGEPIGSVLSIIHRGLARLKTLMENHNEQL